MLSSSFSYPRMPFSSPFVCSPKRRERKAADSIKYLLFAMVNLMDTGWNFRHILWPLLCHATGLRLMSRAPRRPYQRPRIRRHADVRSESVFAAAAVGDTIALDRLVAAGANVDEPWEGFTPLMSAALERQSRVVARLLQAGANPDARHPFGMRALLCAIRSSDYECVRLLLEHGASPRPLFRGDLAPLDLARTMGQGLIADLIVQYLAHRNSAPRLRIPVR